MAKSDRQIIKNHGHSATRHKLEKQHTKKTPAKELKCKHELRRKRLQELEKSRVPALIVKVLPTKMA